MIQSKKVQSGTNRHQEERRAMSNLKERLWEGRRDMTLFIDQHTQNGDKAWRRRRGEGEEGS
jgi:hypothetical protein